MTDAAATPSPAIHATLPERLDTAAVEALRSTIEQAMAQAGTRPARLDASGVGYVGGLCLQVLLASGCALHAPSEKVREALILFGVGDVLSERPLSSSEPRVC